MVPSSCTRPAEFSVFESEVSGGTPPEVGIPTGRVGRTHHQPLSVKKALFPGILNIGHRSWEWRHTRVGRVPAHSAALDCEVWSSEVLPTSGGVPPRNVRLGGGNPDFRVQLERTMALAGAVLSTNSVLAKSWRCCCCWATCFSINLYTGYI